MNTYPLLLACTLAVLGAGCSRKDDAASESAVRPLAVRTQPAAERAFERRLTVQGTLEAKRSAQVATRAEGNLDAVWVDVGDAVVAGETPLFQVDPVSRQNAVTIAEQDLALAQAALTVAKAMAVKTEAESRKVRLDHERYERLHKDARVSDSEFEAAVVALAQATAGEAVASAQVELAERQVAQAQAALGIAHKSLEDTRTVAPISGVVSQRLAEPGEQMSVGRVVLRIDDLSAIEAAAFLPGRYHPDVQAGETRFRLRLQGRDAGSHAVTTKAPTINPVLRTFEIKGIVEGAPDLAVPGAMADLTLVFETREGIGVPSSAILHRGGRNIVFCVQEGQAAAREVRTGWDNEGWTEVLEGLKAGEPVVVEGQTQLAEGSAIDIL